MTLEQLSILMTPYDTIRIQNTKHQDVFPLCDIFNKENLTILCINKPEYAEKDIVSLQSVSTTYDRKGNKSFVLTAILDLDNEWKLFHFDNNNIACDLTVLLDSLSNGFEIKSIDNRLYYREIHA